MLSYRLKRTCASQVRARGQNHYRHSLSAPESFHIPGDSPNISYISTLDLDYLAECGIQEPHYAKRIQAEENAAAQASNMERRVAFRPPPIGESRTSTTVHDSGIQIVDLVRIALFCFQEPMLTLT
uniref:Enhancer of polycomb-like protein 1 n=1 Tax=Caenorhabditis tropicalis TaxID=1561998 RepID=A0A1I7U712_9PELO